MNPGIFTIVFMMDVRSAIPELTRTSMVKLDVKIVNRELTLLIPDRHFVLLVKQVILRTMFRSVDIRNFDSISTWFLFIKVTDLGPAQKRKNHVRCRYNYCARFF